MGASALTTFESHKCISFVASRIRSFIRFQIFKIHDLINPRTLTDFRDVYCVSKLRESDLQILIDLRGTLLGGSHAQLVVFQLLRGLRHLHAAGVAHCNLVHSG